MWENNGSTFSDVTSQLDIADQVTGLPVTSDDFQWNYSTAFSDLDDNGYLDLLYVAIYTNSVVYLNPNGKPNKMNLVSGFTDEAGMGVALGDYDNDGDIDWFITSIWHPDKNYNQFNTGNSGNRLYQNDGNGTFTDVTKASGVRAGYFGWGTCFSDFDNDGDLDLFQTNGYGYNDTDYGRAYLFFESDPSLFFLNNGDGTFTEQASDIGIKHSGQGRGVACFDYDNDNDVDILIANDDASPTLYRNDSSNSHHFLRVQLKGPKKNFQGAGAKIRVSSSPSGKTQLREVRIGANYLSGNEVIAHFGLAKDNKVSTVEVDWEDSKDAKSFLTDVNVDQTLVIPYP